MSNGNGTHGTHGTNGTTNDSAQKTGNHDTLDGKGGVAFGTSVVYDDAYTQDTSLDYVTSLPTAQEELEMERDGDVRAKEEEEYLDEGRVGGFHPSTLAAQSVRVEQHNSCSHFVVNVVET